MCGGRIASQEKGAAQDEAKGLRGGREGALGRIRPCPEPPRILCREDCGQAGAARRMA